MGGMKGRALSLKAEVKKAVIPEALKAVEKDLTSTHVIRRVGYGKEFSVEL
ncbi:MAG: hypothetical protein KJ955_06280 [Nanoarchaeota archaeon]|nr:hypothetical protein [Nanoarchaeota archaeon]